MKKQKPTVSECIANIEETDYKLVRRGKLRFLGVNANGKICLSRGAGKAAGQVCYGGPSYYIFRSESRPPEFRELSFTLNELRHAFHNGF